MNFGPVVLEMSFEDILYVELRQSLCSVDWNHFCNFEKRHHEEESCEIIFEIGPVVQEEIPFKGSSYMELWQPYCSVEHNHFCAVLVKGYYEQQFCEII